MREAKTEVAVRRLRQLVLMIEEQRTQSRENRIRPIANAKQCDGAVRRLNSLRRWQRTNHEFEALQITIGLYLDGVTWDWSMARANNAHAVRACP